MRKKKHNYFTGRRLAEIRQPRTHAYRILCKPYVQKVRVKVKRLEEGKREEEEEEEQLTERFLLGIG